MKLFLVILVLPFITFAKEEKRMPQQTGNMGTLSVSKKKELVEVAKMEINRYLATKKNSKSKTDICHAAGSAQTSFMILSFMGLNAKQTATLLNISVKELNELQSNELNTDSEVCQGF